MQPATAPNCRPLHATPLLTPPCRSSWTATCSSFWTEPTTCSWARRVGSRLACLVCCLLVRPPWFAADRVARIQGRPRSCPLLQFLLHPTCPTHTCRCPRSCSQASPFLPCPKAASCAAPPYSHAPQLNPPCLQVFKELQPGLNISRCSEADFLHFVRLATYCTRYVRLREVRRCAASRVAYAPRCIAARPPSGPRLHMRVPTCGCCCRLF